MAMLDLIKGAVRAFVPQSVLDARRAKAVAATERQFAGKSNRQIFSEIYDKGEWGLAGTDRFCSGTGSHDEAVVTPYIEAVIGFLKSLPVPPNAVDLGCGDFNVGRQVRPFCGDYVACDIVPALITRNIAQFGGDFRCLDIVEDEIPGGDVVFVRQVLQHLGNADIALVIPKLHAFKYVVVTEHLPAGQFVPNIDKPAGKGIRLGLNSGIVVTQPPFGLSTTSQRILCEVGESGGLIRTTLHER